MAGLLDYVSGIVDQAGSNVRGLLSDPMQTARNIIDQLAQRAAAQQAATKAAWATRDPKVMAQNALDSSQTALGFAPLGITAWHGSPHTFDKFSLDKIGTGEGAQAYGHGLYLAESPEVAKSYQDLAKRVGPQVDGAPLNKMNASFAESALINMYQNRLVAGLPPDIAATQTAKWGETHPQIGKDVADSFVQRLAPPPNGSLYKVDLPDSAIARMLDWDKPLSQQSKEVQAAIEKMKKHVPGGMFSESLQPFERGNSTGSSLHRAFESDIASTGNGQASKTFSMLANEYGIPGIRYLDGGSRSAGQGSSNFVVFDPEMIRILERNGQATGAVPWQPGEWRGLLGK